MNDDRPETEDLESLRQMHQQLQEQYREAWKQDDDEDCAIIEIQLLNIQQQISKLEATRTS
jgi:uncharacterized membrane protein (DUF106 family)